MNARACDEELLSLFGEPGCEQPSREFVGRFLPYVLAILGARGISRDDAEDLVQEVFERVLRKKSQFIPRGEGSARAWIAEIARNLAVDTGRRKGTLPTDCLEGPNLPDDSSESVLEQVEHDEEIALLHEALKRLPAEQQAVILLSSPARASHGLGTMTQQGICDLLGYSRPVEVYRRLVQAVDELRDSLETTSR